MPARPLIGVLVLRDRASGTWVARLWDGEEEREEPMGYDARATGRFVRARAAARYGLPIDLVVEG